MPINVNITAEDAHELTHQVKALASELGLFSPCNCAKAAVPTMDSILQGAPSCINQTESIEPTTSDDNQEPEETDSAFDNTEDKNYGGDNDDDDDDNEDEDNGLSKDESFNPEIAEHFDEIFGTVGNRPMPGNRVRINGTLFQGEGTVKATNYSALYNPTATYDTKVMKVKADNGKSYSYNISDLRAKKVAKV